MNITQKAKQLGITKQSLSGQLKTNPSAYGAQKVGRNWIFPDDTKSPSQITVKEYPSIEESGKKKAYYDALKSEQEYLHKLNANQVASGNLVQKDALEAEFKRIYGELRSKVLNLPVKLKNKLGDELSTRAEAMLEQAVDDILNEVADGAA